MAANYLHGIETIEVERGPRAVRVVKSAVIAVVGTAPTGPVNELTLSLSVRDDAAFGPDMPGFGIPEALEGIHAFGAGTVLVVNVLNPSVHKDTVTGETATFGVNDRLQLDNPAIQTLTLKATTGNTTYVAGTDYELDAVRGRIIRIATGAIPAQAGVKADYDYADPSKVTPADIIGGINALGQRRGLKLLADAYNLFGFFPKILLAPGFSTNNASHRVH